MSGRREQAGGGQDRKGAAPFRGCSCKAASPAAAWRRTRGAEEAAADVSGPVEGARAKGNSSSGGARKGAAPPTGRSSSGRLERRSDGREERAMGKKDGIAMGERKIGSFLQNGLRGCGRLIVKLPHLCDVRAIVSFDITRREFGVFPCPPCIATWNSGSASSAFVVELEGTLCDVLADPDAEELTIWKRENGQWHSAYTVYLEGWPGYSLGANVVVPWAVDPKDRKILLSTRKKLGFYDPARRSIEDLYDLEEVLRVRSTTEQSSRVAVPENPHIAKLKRVLEKFCSQESLLVQHKF